MNEEIKEILNNIIVEKYNIPKTTKQKILDNLELNILQESKTKFKLKKENFKSNNKSEDQKPKKLSNNINKPKQFIKRKIKR